MHQPQATPRPSIFYDYQVYPFIRPPELDGRPVRHQAIVVGAGPIGLVTALDLARYGIRTVVLTAEQQVSEGSRALAYTRRSMEILQQVGVGQRIAHEGLPWRYGVSFFRGKPVFNMDMGYDDNDRFYPATTLPQQYLEQYLVEQIAADPLVELRWASNVVGIEHNDANGVALRVDTPQGEYLAHADWVVAADGARSTLRQQLGLRMEGESYEGRFVIVDIEVDLPFPTKRRAYFDPVWNPGNTVLMHRATKKMWRLDYQLPPNETPEQALDEASLKQRVDAQLAMVDMAGTPWRMDWCSVYSARAMTLPEYVHGRIVFTGDAAHMLPIFGVRGANTGFQDAQNLAWKLAFVMKGLAGPALLPSYSVERVAAAREIVAEASKSTRFMTPPTRGFRLLRDAVLSAALTHEFVRPLLHWRTSRPHEYTTSPLNGDADGASGFKAGPPSGAVIRNIALGKDDYLFDHLGASFYVFHFSNDGDVPNDLAAAVDSLQQQGLPIAIVAFRRSTNAVANAHLTFNCSSNAAFEMYGVQTTATYLVRPDQHVRARWLDATGAQLRKAMRTAVGRG